jgi:hypothetical protein
MSSVIDKAVDFAVNVANDNSHGYDQIHRWLNPDVDCSSLVILSFENAGVPVKSKGGATYTGNMKSAFVKCGFEAIPYKKPMGLMKGDVILNEKHHTCLYIGGGKIVQASINEKGKATGGVPGDQTSREVLVCNFYEYSKGWDYVLRYREQEVKTVNVEMQVLKQGDKGEQVKTLQRLLKELGYNGRNSALVIDGDFGTNTAYAVGALQTTMKNKGIINNVDYIVGQYTWNYLLKGV